MQPGLWTCRSLRNLVKELAKKGHKVCPTVVGDLLRSIGYSLQANSKTREGGKHIDRDAQFQYINTQAKAFLTADEPVISVDTKKKELVGNFKNNGREWRPKGTPEPVNIHDFIDPVNAGEILQRLAGVKVQHGRKQEGPRYRGPSCLSRFIPEGQPPTAVLTVLGVTGAWSERA